MAIASNTEATPAVALAQGVDTKGGYLSSTWDKDEQGEKQGLERKFVGG